MSKHYWDWRQLKGGHPEGKQTAKERSLFFNGAEQCPPLLMVSNFTTPGNAEQSQWEHLPPSPNKPIFLPGYPGSGSELLRDLIPLWTKYPALDGHRSWNASQRRACIGAVTCKTHWPAMKQQRHPKAMIPRAASHPTEAWILLRNPLHAIPSYFSWDWEWRNKITGHTQQMPEAAWIARRDELLQAEIFKWCNLVRTWYNTTAIREAPRMSPRVPPVPGSFLIQYESLTHPSQGAVFVERMRHQFIEAGYAMDSSSLQDMLCQWKAVVFDRPRVRRKKTYTPLYTLEQLHFVLLELLNLRSDTAVAFSLKDLEVALDEYIAHARLLLQEATGALEWNRSNLSI